MIFGALLGVIGAIIAVPIIASIQIVVKELTDRAAREDGGAASAARPTRRRRRRDVVGSPCEPQSPARRRGGREP